MLLPIVGEVLVELVVILLGDVIGVLVLLMLCVLLLDGHFLFLVLCLVLLEVKHDVVATSGGLLGGVDADDEGLVNRALLDVLFVVAALGGDYRLVGYNVGKSINPHQNV